jgi:hypothetical protein
MLSLKGARQISGKSVRISIFIGGEGPTLNPPTQGFGVASAHSYRWPLLIVAAVYDRRSNNATLQQAIEVNRPYQCDAKRIATIRIRAGTASTLQAFNASTSSSIPRSQAWSVARDAQPSWLAKRG